MCEMCVCVFVHEYSRFLHILVHSPFFFLNAEVSTNKRLVGSERDHRRGRDGLKYPQSKINMTLDTPAVLAY